MTWFDLVVLLLAGVVILFEARQEAGRGLLDAVVTVGAVQLTGRCAEVLTVLLGWKPLPGTEVAPLAAALCFAFLWGVGLCLSRWIHQCTRWTMDNYDPVFGVAFGLLITLAAGHALVDSVAGMVVSREGVLPDYLRHSCFAQELREFRTYHFVANIVQNSRYNE
jgi:hypothetical protein